jgi:hypothetical protein
MLDFKLRSLLKLNYKLFLDHMFIREGGFININKGKTFYDGSDMSLMLPDTNAHNFFTGMQIGQVWQSPFRQHVYESGVPLDGTRVTDPPIVASGLFINNSGIPFLENDPVHPHTIDYLNGRVIFENPLPLNSVIQGQFSTREVRIDFEHAFNQQFNDGFLESRFTTNPLTSNHITYPSGTAQPFPAVFIEVDGRNFDAYELGNRSAIIKDTLKLHIWALNDIQRDNIVDILTSQWRKSLPIIDFNMAPLPLSGIFNGISNEYVPYQKMLENRHLITTVGSGVPIRFTSYIDKVTSMNLPAAEEFERSMVTYEVHVYLNAPTTPLGHVFGPISTIPTIQDAGGFTGG